jgi:hypothetical protein
MARRIKDGCTKKYASLSEKSGKLLIYFRKLGKGVSQLCALIQFSTL